MRPLPRAPRPWHFPDVMRGEAGGLAVRACHLPGQRLASIRLVLPGGAAAEPDDACGVTTLAARALVGDAVAERAEAHGAVLDVDVSWDSCAVVVAVPVDRLARAFDVIAAMLADPPDVGRITQVRARRIEELARESADPATSAARRLAVELHGPGSRYGRPLAGDAKGIERLSVARIAEHGERLARAPGATLVVAGDLAGCDVTAEAARAFAGWSPAGETAPARPAEPILAGQPRVVLVDRPGASQSAVVLGTSAPSRTAPDHAALALAAMCAAGIDGRLNQRLRERDGVAYRVSGGLEAHRGSGLFAAYFACATEATGDAVAAAIAEALRDIAENGVREPEAALARAASAGGLAMALHRPAGLAAALAEATVVGLPEDEPVRLRAAYDTTSVADVDAAIARYLHPARIVVAVSGDAARLADVDGAVNTRARKT